MAENHPEHRPMRAADADRDRTAERLGYAMSEGRLELTEYQKRLEQAMSAKTLDELTELTEDLPLSTEESRRAERSRQVEVRKRQRRAVVREVQSWLGVAVILNAIWGFSSIQSGHLQHYWPAFPLGVWAVILIAHLLSPRSRNGGSGPTGQRPRGPGGPHGPDRRFD